MFNRHFSFFGPGHSSSLRGAWPVVLAFAGTAALPAAAAPSITTAHAVEDIVPTLESTVRDQMEKWGTPGVAIGIVAEDRLVYAKGFGVGTKGSPDAVTLDSIFEIGSTTKAFLGVTLAMCVEDGLLNWKDKVVDHYPGFQLADGHVTHEFQIDDLLAQRSGLPASTLTNLMVYGYDRKDIIHAMRYIEPVTSFRSAFAYQNAFHLVADELVAQVNGVASWDAFLKDRLLQPLHMDNTTTAQMPDGPDGTLQTAGHLHTAEGTVVNPEGPFLDSAGGAGNIRSSVSDLAQWVRLHLAAGEVDGTRLIDASSLDATYIPRIALDGPMADEIRLGHDDTMAYATGWVTHATPQGRLIEHAGGTIGYNSHIGFDPDRKFGFIVLVNQSYQGGTGLAIPFGKTIADLLQGRPDHDYPDILHDHISADMQHQKQARKAPDNARAARPLEAYAGTYRSPVMGTISIGPGHTSDLDFALGPYDIRVSLSHDSGDTFMAAIPVPTDDGRPSHVDYVKVSFVADENDDIHQMQWLGEGDNSGQPAFMRHQP